MNHFEIAYKHFLLRFCYDVTFEIHDIDYADKFSLNHRICRSFYCSININYRKDYN